MESGTTLDGQAARLGGGTLLQFLLEFGHTQVVGALGVAHYVRFAVRLFGRFIVMFFSLAGAKKFR